VLLEAARARRRQAYRSRQDIADERFQDWAVPEDYDDTSDERFRERWAREPEVPVPAHQVARYRHYHQS
jgi:hypothetical protein